MNKKDELIEIDVDITRDPAASRPPGYRFRYASSSRLVEEDGNTDLTSVDERVMFRFRLMNATFDKDDPVWIAQFDKGGPVPCPTRCDTNGAIKEVELINASTLQFLDKNKDKKRYAYALRCKVGDTEVMDDPVIINR